MYKQFYAIAILCSLTLVAASPAQASPTGQTIDKVVGACFGMSSLALLSTAFMLNPDNSAYPCALSSVSAYLGTSICCNLLPVALRVGVNSSNLVPHDRNWSHTRAWGGAALLGMCTICTAAFSSLQADSCNANASVSIAGTVVFWLGFWKAAFARHSTPTRVKNS